MGAPGAGVGLGEAGKGSWASERASERCGDHVCLCVCARPRGCPGGAGGLCPQGWGVRRARESCGARGASPGQSTGSRGGTSPCLPSGRAPRTSPCLPSRCRPAVPGSRPAVSGFGVLGGCRVPPPPLAPLPDPSPAPSGSAARSVPGGIFPKARRTEPRPALCPRLVLPAPADPTLGPPACGCGVRVTEMLQRSPSCAWCQPGSALSLWVLLCLQKASPGDPIL